MEQEEKERNLQEYLSFELGEEKYALNILNVREIRTYSDVTPVANSPAFIKGVMNLRGVVIPILDLRIKFDIGLKTYDSHTTVIITTIDQRHVGLVVDGVSDVLKIGEDDVSDTPGFNSTLDVEYLEGIANVDDEIVILVDTRKLLSNKEMGVVNEVAGSE
jgi:purine-binding chemotaxis protein CheW